ncbi:PAS-domain containing protein [Roseicella aquatilis]|uniref:histidine kinase n=1 Tax=Roseicella aquatilis TaxID=2527868 RepID=A0A4R4DV34_9PROT|nr:PAS-domain containing protein [Roseicella aquatilis]TCZ64323.1 PAS domain-containing protein [Roseicella aquatilis]
MTSRGAAEEVLAAGLTVLPVALLVFGPDRGLVFANPASERFTGLPPAQLPPGTLLEDLVRTLAYRGIYGHGEPESLAAAHLQVDRSRPFRRRIRRTDGAFFEQMGAPLPGGGFVVAAMEVTPFLAATEEAEARGRRLETLLSHLHGGIAAFDEQHRMLLSNPAYEDLIGLPRGTVRPGTPHDAVFRMLAERGEFANQDAEAVLADRACLDRSRPLAYPRVRPNGQVLRCESQPLPEGGYLVEVTDITAAKQAEEEAQRRAALLNGVLASLPHGVVVFGADGRVAMVNAAHQAILAGAEVAVGEHRAEIARRRAGQGEYGPGDPAGLAALHAHDGADRPVPAQRERPNGTVLDIRHARLPDGGIVQVTTDITELQAARTEVTAQAATLQTMLDTMRHGIALYDAGRRLIATNRLAGEMGGTLGRTTRIGMTFDEIVAAQHHAGRFGSGPDAEAQMAWVLGLDRSQPVRYRRRMACGRVIETHSDPTPEGGFVITWTDITAQARAEEEAQHRADLLQAMLDNIRHGIALFDREGRVQAVNPVFLELLDLPAEVMATGGSFGGFIDHLLARGEYGPAEEGRAIAARLKARDRRQPSLGTRTRPNGMVLEIASEPVPGGGWVLALTDVTEDRRVRAEVERAKDAAETANRAKSRFLATMTHELRTPLNAVIGFSEALLTDPDPARARDYVTTIHEAGRQLLSLIDDILDVTRAETTGVPTVEGEVALIPLVEATLRVMQATATAAGVTLDISLPPALPPLRADELRLRQVLLNLVSNAVKFTPRGGRVAVGAMLEPGGDLVLRVSDSGIGILPEDIPRAFEPFTQLDSSLSRRFHGSGLGLYLSRALAEAQGATLMLESTPGVGTVAILRFPKSRLLASLAV